jgi:hypothetical protein
MQADRTINDLILEYQESAMGTADPNPTDANRYARQLIECYKKLRETPSGKEALLELISDENAHVRCWAATHCLEWAPEVAKEELVTLSMGDGPCAFDAQMVLEEFNKGRLSFQA